MKYIFLITTFISINLSLNTTESNYNKNTSVSTLPPSLAEQYYDKLEVKTNLPKMLNKFLDRRALTRTEVPLNLWQEIKNSIDYDSFKTEVVAIIPNFYTNAELQTILNEHSNRPKVPITKLDFRRELAQKIQNFDVIFLNTVNSILTNNGYSPL